MQESFDRVYWPPQQNPWRDLFTDAQMAAIATIIEKKTQRLLLKLKRADVNFTNDQVRRFPHILGENVTIALEELMQARGKRRAEMVKKVAEHLRARDVMRLKPLRIELRSIAEEFICIALEHPLDVPYAKKVREIELKVVKPTLALRDVISNQQLFDTWPEALSLGLLSNLTETRAILENFETNARQLQNFFRVQSKKGTSIRTIYRNILVFRLVRSFWRYFPEHRFVSTPQDPITEFVEFTASIITGKRREQLTAQIRKAIKEFQVIKK
jgi:hypothetical protein